MLLSCPPCPGLRRDHAHTAVTRPSLAERLLDGLCPCATCSSVSDPLVAAVSDGAVRLAVDHHEFQNDSGLSFAFSTAISSGGMLCRSTCSISFAHHPVPSPLQFNQL